MKNKNTSPPPADLHSPKELLANAMTMHSSGDPIVLRASLLEAMTALEAYVQKVVFSALRNQIDANVVALLEKNTRMDFDARVRVLIPATTGVSIDPKTELWNCLKRAKKIRNVVVHAG